MLNPDNPLGEVHGNTEGPTLVGTVFLAEMPGHLSEAAGRIAAPQGSLQAPLIHVTGQQAQVTAKIPKIFPPQYEQTVWFLSTGTA